MSGKCNLQIDTNSDFEMSIELQNDDGTALELDDFTAIFASENCIISPTVEIDGSIVNVFVGASETREITDIVLAYNIALVSTTARHRILEGKIYFNQGVNCEN